MRKYSIRIWTQKKGIVTETHNGMKITDAIERCESNHAFAGIILSAQILFEDNEIFKLTNRLDKPLKLETDENVLTD